MYKIIKIEASNSVTKFKKMKTSQILKIAATVSLFSITMLLANCEKTNETPAEGATTVQTGSGTGSGKLNASDTTTKRNLANPRP